MTPAGNRDRRISFHTEVLAGEDAYGAPVAAGYPKTGGARARINYGKGSERREAAVERADQVATFVVPSRASSRTVTTKNLIKFDDVFWDITSIAAWGRSEIEFTAIRRTA